VVNQQLSSKRVREQRSDDGPAILPGMEHFIDLLRKVKRPTLVVRLLPNVPAVNRCRNCMRWPKPPRQIAGRIPACVFSLRGQLDAAIRQRLEDVVERVLLLGDDYGAQAVQSVLDERREDDAAVLEAPSDRHSRALHLCILQEFPEAGPVAKLGSIRPSMNR
jgi:hypothetical protein